MPNKRKKNGERKGKETGKKRGGEKAKGKSRGGKETFKPKNLLSGHARTSKAVIWR